MAVKANETLQDAIEQELRQRAAEGVVIENEQHPREPELAPVGAGSATALSGGGGLNMDQMVPEEGLEPPTRGL